MSCDNLIHQLGFECQKVADDVMSVSTPFVFADGEVINFYMEDRTPEVVISDNGDTLFHLRSIGLDLSDRRRWRPYRQIVAAHGFNLRDSGEIIGKSHIDQSFRLVANYISTMLEIVNLEHEQLGIPEDLNQFLQEVEFYLHAWKPTANITHLPTLYGISGKPHTFHFDFDGTLVDAARPNSNKTGAILRKLADLGMAGLIRPVLVVMDDREDKGRAKTETEILSSVASVMSIGQLIQNAGNLLEKH